MNEKQQTAVVKHLKTIYMKVEIELIENTSTETQFSGWKVTYGDKYADQLGYDEMLGLVAAITMPEKRHTLQWLKTDEEHQQWRDNLAKNINDTVDDSFTDTYQTEP